MDALYDEIGFTQYERDVYKSLLQSNNATAPLLSQRTGIATNKVYEALLSLIEQGFVASRPVRPKQFYVTGTQCFYDFLARKKKEIDAHYLHVKVLEQTIAKHQEQRALVLQGKKQMMHLLTEQTRQSARFIYSFVGHLSFDYRSAQVVKDALARGVDVRFLVHKKLGRQSVLAKWEALGVRIRFYPKEEQKSIRFTTFDGTVARLTIGEPEITVPEAYLSFWVESPALSLLLKDQFLSMWRKSSG